MQPLLNATVYNMYTEKCQFTAANQAGTRSLRVLENAKLMTVKTNPKASTLPLLRALF
jgi:hypothetical protein